MPSESAHFNELEPLFLEGLKDLCAETGDPDVYSDLLHLIARSHHHPEAINLVLESSNELLNGYGVKHLKGCWISAFYGRKQASYVNLGDSKLPTLIRDHLEEEWLIERPSDFAEKYPDRFLP